MMLNQQLEIMVNARFVISPIGAGSAMTMFAREDAKIIEISKSILSGNYNGKVSAFLLNQHFQRLIMDKQQGPPDLKQLKEDYNCDLAKLDAVVNGIELLGKFEKL